MYVGINSGRTLSGEKSMSSSSFFFNESVIKAPFHVRNGGEIMFPAILRSHNYAHLNFPAP